MSSSANSSNSGNSRFRKKNVGLQASDSPRAVLSLGFGNNEIGFLNTGGKMEFSIRRMNWVAMAVLSLLALMGPALSFAQYQVNGDASQTSCECFEVTPELSAQAGSVWNVTQIDLNQPFDYTFDIFLGCNNFNSGADGMAFVLQPLNVNAGSAGGGLGYAGINPSLAVEFDTFNNSQYADLNNDHIAIMSNGVVDHNLPNNLAGPVDASSTSGDVEDCAWHTVQIVWDPGLTTIAVFFDGVFRTAYFGDIINNIFGGSSQVYWGFTGSTGGAYNQQQFCINLQPEFTLPTTSACVGEPVNFTESSVASNTIQNYSWDFGDSNTATGANVSHTYAAAGQYDVILTITSDGCDASITQQITIDPLPVVNLGADVAVCDGQSVQLNNPNTVGAGTYVWSPNTELDNAGIASPTSTPTSTHTYTLDFTDANGCSASDDIVVTHNPLPVANAGPDDGLCDGASVQLNASGGTSYSWDNAGSLDNAAVADPIASPTVNTIYTVTVTDANNCSNSDQVQVIIYPLPAIDAGPDLTVCEGFGTQLNVIGTGTVAWDPDPTLSDLNIPNPMATPAVTTTYTATLTDGNGCQSSDDVVVNVVTILPVNAGPDLQICVGETPQLNGTGAVSYSWSPPLGLDNPNIADPIFSGVVDATITLTGTDGNGCVNTDDITITVNPLPAANAGPDQTLCTGSGVVLQASGGVTYSWDNAGTLDNPNASGPVADPTNSTTYTVTVTDANNCFASDQVDVTVVPLPAIDAGADVSICDGETIQLSAIGIGSFSWDNAATLDDDAVADPNANPSVTTTYTVTLTDANNCSNTDDVEVTVFETPVAILNDPVPVCDGSTMLFPDNSSGPITTWDWDFGDLTIGSGQDPTHIYPALGAYTVSLTVTSANNCSSSTTATANVITGPTAAISVSNGIQFCENDCVEFHAGASTGPIANYLWDFGDQVGNPGPNTTSPDSASVFCYSESATYDVTLTVSTADGCFNTVSQTIPVNPNPEAGFTSSVACEGEQTIFTDTSSVSGGFIATHNWYFGDSNLSDLSDPLHEYAGLGTYDVVLAISSQLGCVDTAYGQVTVHETPDVSISATNVCEGLMTDFTNSTVSGVGIANWDWTFGDGQSSTEQSPSIEYAGHGSYYTVLAATTVDGCTSWDSVTAQVYAVPVASIDASSLEGCEPHSVQFYNNSTVASGNLESFSWDVGNSSGITSVAPSVDYTQEGTYNVSVIAVGSEGGCSDTVSVTDMITVHPTPQASFSFSPSEEITMLDPRVSFTNTSVDAIDYAWYFGDGNSSNGISPTHTFTETGIYGIQLHAYNNGCEDVAMAEVRVHPETFIYIPNSFTPNNDGINDTFKPEGVGVKSYSLVIHDRWGKEMFQTSNWEQSWNGTFLGKRVPQGVYVYRVEISDVRDLAHQYMGSITISY